MKHKSPILWIIQKIRKRIPALILMTLSYVSGAVLSVVFALGNRNVIDSAVSGSADAFWRACLLQGLVILGILTTIFLNRYLHERIMIELDRDWKKDLLHGLLHGEYSHVSAYHSGELLNRLNNDVRALNTAVLSIVPSTASMITKLVCALGVLLAIEPWFMLAVVAAGAAMLLVTSLVRPILKKLNRRVSEEEGRVSGFLQETLEKLLMVQAMDVSGEMEQRADVFMENRFRAQSKRKNVQMVTHTCINLLSYGSGFAALVFCAGGLLQGTMTFGTLTAVVELVSQLRSPLVNMSGVIPLYIGMLTAAERLMELDEMRPEQLPVSQPAQELYEDMAAIEGRDLCFAYDRDAVFTNANFRVEKGQFGVILGHSGIGKSTLLKIMLGVFKPSSGGVYVCGTQRELQLDRSTRRLFAYVPQGNLLLSGTIRDNLIITRPDATEEQIQQAIHISAMDDYLPSLPKGLDTVIGESGAGLSEGQAQRLSIARAVLADAPILLLDEATSALDAQTEQLVLERLSSLPGKTCIAVTHRPAAIALSDWTMEMRDGQCVVTKR